jgi:hypothetical protein
LWLWRKQSLFQLSPADVEIRTGESQPSTLQFSPLSSRSKFNIWGSRSKPVRILAPYDTGASVTKIGAIYRNGCLVRGASKWSRPLAKPRSCDGNRGVRPGSQSFEHSLQSHRFHASPEAPMPPGEKRIRTLVIDDAFDFMQAICRFLENLPIRCCDRKGPQRVGRGRAGSRVEAGFDLDGRQDARDDGTGSRCSAYERTARHHRNLDDSFRG